MQEEMRCRTREAPEAPVGKESAGGSGDALHADGVSYQAYYSAVGKAHHTPSHSYGGAGTGKDLTGVRSLQRKLVPDKVGLEQYEPTSLQGIATKAEVRTAHRFQDLYRCLNARFLADCWKDLNKDAASGIDQVTAEAYEENLEANIKALEKRLRQKRYRAKLVRRCYIPKGNGEERPLGIPALEDRLLQLACAKILTSIFESDFVETSYAYRPKRSAKEAIEDLQFNLQFGKFGYIVEADIQGFFDNIDHDWVLRMLRERIDDAAFLTLLGKWLKAGVLDTDGKVIHPESGTPQGGSVSPVLANVYLHFALDLWFEKRVKAQSCGEAFILRYADDFICAFRYRDDAERFYHELPNRLSKFKLAVAPEKSEMIRFSRFHPGMQSRIMFLGFEAYWMEDPKGAVKVRLRTARKKLHDACRRIKGWIKENRHLKGANFIRALNRRLQGHYNYFNVPGNLNSLWRFYHWSVECAFKWLNRRGGKRKSFTWKVFTRAIDRLGVAKPQMEMVNRKHRVFV